MDERRKLVATWQLDPFDDPIPERIECAAIKFMGTIYALERPNRHNDVIAFIGQELGLRLYMGNSEQGFLTNWGAFLNRKHAEVVARRAGQVDELIGSILTSEDMW